MNIIQRKKKSDSVITAIVLVFILTLVFVLEQTVAPTSMLFTVLKKGIIYSLAAVSLNLLNGFTGLFSLGQAGFMLLGAYTYAIFTIPVAQKDNVYMYYDCAVKFSFPDMFTNIFGSEKAGMVLGVILAIICAGVVAAVFAWLIGKPVLRLKSDYLAIATLGFAEIIRAFFQWSALGPITNGSNLLKNYPSLNDFNIRNADGDVVVYISTLLPVIVVGLCIYIIIKLINSSYGRAFKAIREDEIAAEAMGIDLAKHKMMAFCISAFFAGISGALLAMFQNTVQAIPFKSMMTYEILLIVVIGGIGSISGSVISSFIFIFFSEWLLRGLDSGTFLGITAPILFRAGFRKVILAAFIILIVLFYNRGIMGDKELSVSRIRIWRENRKNKLKEAKDNG